MDTVVEYEQRTGRRLGDELSIEYAVPCLDRDDCRRVFGNDRAGAEEFARGEGGVVELRLVTPWRPA